MAPERVLSGTEPQLTTVVVNYFANSIAFFLHYLTFSSTSLLLPVLASQVSYLYPSPGLKSALGGIETKTESAKWMELQPLRSSCEAAYVMENQTKSKLLCMVFQPSAAM